MKKSLENRISMFNTVKAVCNANIATINANAGLDALYTQYLAMLEDIQFRAQEQTLNRTGITIDKRNMRILLANAVYNASGIIKAHFDSVSNYDVFISVNVSLSRLLVMRDQILIAHTQTVIDLLTTHQAVLAPFGVDAAYITQLTGFHTDFITLTAKPTAARNDKSAATAILQEKVTDVSMFLKNEFDNAMLAVRPTNNTFYITYRFARRIVDNGIRHEDDTTGTVTGVVKDNNTDQVIPDAIVEIINTETLVITNELGEFTIINIPPATYDIKVSVGNYQSKTIENVVVAATETTELEVKLLPAP